MNKTANYQLSQWAKSDRVLMEDFNADNAKIDAGIRAAETHIDQVAATVPKVAVGTYTGNGAARQSISVGFRPKAVLIMREDGSTRSEASHAFCYGGLVLDGHPIQITASNQGAIPLTCAEIYSSGFRACYNNDSYSTVHACLNASDTVYHYIAIG